MHGHICTCTVQPSEGTIVSKTAIVKVHLQKASQSISGDETVCIFARLKGRNKEKRENRRVKTNANRPHSLTDLRRKICFMM